MKRHYMKQALRIVAVVAAISVAAASSGVVWYAFSAPPAQHLALAHDLVDGTSAQGRQLLAETPARRDYDQLNPYFVSQSRRAFCGVATGAVVINAALRPQTPVTQETLFTPAASAVRSELAVSFNGLTLDQLADIIRAHGLYVQVVHAAQSSLESFRDTARATLAEPQTFLIVNYDRAMVEQEGPGHISPVGAYSAETDRILVLDVAAYKYPYTWVPTSKLWSAMNTIDPDSGRTRGYLLVSGGSAQDSNSAPRT
jgi:glutathione-S-conjugate glycine hydrolase